MICPCFVGVIYGEEFAQLVVFGDFGVSNEYEAYVRILGYFKISVDGYISFNINAYCCVVFHRWYVCDGENVLCYLAIARRLIRILAYDIRVGIVFAKDRIAAIRERVSCQAVAEVGIEE